MCVCVCVCVGSMCESAVRPEEGVLRAVLLSMGRTMSQEDVQQLLMQRTVQQVRLLHYGRDSE